MPKIAITCKNCEQIFYSYPRYKKHERVDPIFCSARCHKIYSNETRKCPTCGMEFRSNKSRPKEFCSRTCAQRKDRVKLICIKCEKPFFISPSHAAFRKHCSHECKSNRVTYTCEICGASRNVPTSSTAKRFCGDTCRLIWFAGAFTNEDSPHWKGGSLSYGPNWKRQRNLARSRDHLTCQHCGVHQKDLPVKLSVAHKIPFRSFDNYKEANRLSNLLSLCISCHLIFDWNNGTRT